MPRRPVFWFFSRIVEKIPFLKRLAIDLFENIYFDSAKTTWDDMSCLGISCQKYPTDLWIYQEIIFSLKPDVIIETGTLYDGSALYLASLLDLIGHGRVISIDFQRRLDRPRHPRVTYITGSSVSPDVISELEPPDYFADQIISLLRDEPARERLGKTATETANKYDWSAVADRFEKILHHVSRISVTGQPVPAPENRTGRTG
jgi:hypothetical protein